MKRYNVDVNLAWSYDHHPSREALDEVPSSEGKWVLATDALPIEAERDRLFARVAELEEREKRCATMDDAEKHALFRGLQEIAVIVGDDDPSPASITKKVAAIVARVVELEANVKMVGSTGAYHE